MQNGPAQSTNYRGSYNTMNNIQSRFGGIKTLSLGDGQFATIGILLLTLQAKYMYLTMVTIEFKYFNHVLDGIEQIFFCTEFFGWPP
jgi:hypothetical protein